MGRKFKRAINLLEEEDRTQFLNFVNSKVSFNPHNMFICKSKNTFQIL